MDAMDLVNEIDWDDMEDIWMEMDDDFQHKPYKLALIQMHCYNEVDNTKLILSKTEP